MTNPQRSLQAVLVLYRRGPFQSEAFVSLTNLLALHPSLAQSIDLLLYDNSPTSQVTPQQLPHGIQYMHDPNNGGLLAAYNAALSCTEGTHKHWLMLLDQDTVVTLDYLNEALAVTQKSLAATHIVALVPRLEERGRSTSPSTRQLIRDRPFPPEVTGVVPEKVSAFNSGAIFRVAALKHIGGFPREFPIESLDHAVFHLLQQHGGKVFIMNSTMEHALSMNNIASSMSLERYEAVLAAEALFTSKYGSNWARIRMRIRFLRLSLKQLLHKQERQFVLTSLRYTIKPRNQKLSDN